MLELNTRLSVFPKHQQDFCVRLRGCDEKMRIREIDAAENIQQSVMNEKSLTDERKLRENFDDECFVLVKIFFVFLGKIVNKRKSGGRIFLIF
jgi:hypothetical protein